MIELDCVPYAGGAARAYLPWARHCPAGLTVHGLELPGHGRRINEAVLDDVDLLARDIAASIAARSTPGTDLALFGHSLGAVLAYETAHILLREYRIRPRRLIVSAYRAPHLQLREMRIAHLDDDDFLARVIELGATQAELFANEEMRELLLPSLRADFALSERYRPVHTTALPIPISVFGGVEDSDVTRAELEQWRDYTSADCVVRQLAGDHFYCHSNTAELLRLIGEDLARTPERTS